MLHAHRFILPTLALLTSCVSAAEYEIKPLTDEQAEEYKLDTAFYKKCTLVQGILIATSDQVSDLAHQESAYLFDKVMTSIDSKVAQRIRDRKVLCILIGHQELTSQLPQFGTDKTGKELDFYNWRSRGFLTHKNKRPTVVFAEEDVLEYEGGMRLESILIHEFGHVIHGVGFDKELQDRLTETFQRARAKGIWNDGRAAQRFRRVKGETPVSLFDALVKSFPDQPSELITKCLDGGDILVNGKPTNSKVTVTKHDKVLIMFGGPKECYAHKNRAEYWAEGVQCWYDTNRTMDHDHNHIHTRAQLRAYDPALAELCADVLGSDEWRFVSPRRRAGKDHLADFDPKTSPKVVDPQHIQNAAYDYYDEYWKDYWQRLHDKHAETAAPCDVEADGEDDVEQLKERVSKLEKELQAVRRELAALTDALNKKFAESSAASKNLDIQVLKGGWGGAGTQDIHAVCLSAAKELWKHFPEQTIDPISIRNSNEGPLVVFGKGSRGERRVLLNVEGLHWAQFAYQFSHEFCHVLCNYRSAKNPNLWFEESLCEAASLFAMRRMAETWKTNPPYSNWKGYSSALANYANDRIEAVPSRDSTFAEWYRENAATLRKTATNRALNQVVANELIGRLENDPKQWRAVSYLNQWDKSVELSLEAYLADWHRRVPDDHKPFVADIAKLFELPVE